MEEGKNELQDSISEILMKEVMEGVQHTFIETHFVFFRKRAFHKNISYLCGGLSSLT